MLKHIVIEPDRVILVGACYFTNVQTQLAFCLDKLYVRAITINLSLS